MFRHYLIAALRNLAANKLQSAIAILGLSVGIAAAILAGVVVRNQTTYDHFIPGYERTYVQTHEGPPGEYGFFANAKLTALLKLASPEIETVTQLYTDQKSFQRGNVESDEHFYWGDAHVFDVLPLPAFRGDLKTALTRPASVVLTRRMAQKYFGRDDAIGQTLTIEGQPMTVRAILENLPVNATGLVVALYGTGDRSLYAHTELGAIASGKPNIMNGDWLTYMRLKPGADIAAVQQKTEDIYFKIRRPGDDSKPIWVPIDRVNLHDGLYPGAKSRVAITALAGFLILLIAAINFVNLLTSRAARRAVEVGIRKACGASRADLVMQFVGEAILTVLLASLIGIALAEWLLPLVNAFLRSGARLDYWRDPRLAAVLLGSAVFLGVLAGAYPAFIMAAFRPGRVLKSMMVQLSGAVRIRNALVILQFALLIMLTLATAVIYRQYAFATREALRATSDQMLVVQAPCTAFRDEIRKLPGVAGVFCTDAGLESPQDFVIDWKGARLHVTIAQAEPGVFGLLGVRPLAGALVGTTDHTVIEINETALHYFGFSSAQAAIGQTLVFPDPALEQGPTGRCPYPRRTDDGQCLLPGSVAHRIIAVVPDFSFVSVETPIRPTIYAPLAYPAGGHPHPRVFNTIKLDGRQLPETVAAAIDRLWTRLGTPGYRPGRDGQLPREHYFLNDHIQQLYDDMLREEQMCTAFAAVAIFLACLGLFGLFGLSIAAAERRVKEIGVRKAMGARTGDILALLLWQFARPVLWANLIAWPIAWWVMNRWLESFAYHVPLNRWLFPAAGGAALGIALLTVAGQAILVARQRPVLALRYE